MLKLKRRELLKYFRFDFYVGTLVSGLPHPRLLNLLHDLTTSTRWS